MLEVLVSNATKKLLSVAMSAAPTWLFLPGLRRRWSREIRLTRDSAPVHLPEATGIESLDIVLDETFFLIRRLRFPAAARKDLGNAVRLRLRQMLPRASETVVHRISIVSQNAQSIDVDAVILKTSLLNEVLSAAESVGASIRTVRAAAPKNIDPFLDNRKETDRALFFWAMMTLFVFTIGVLGLFVTMSNTVEMMKRHLSEISEQNGQLMVALMERQRDLVEQDGNSADILSDAAMFERGFLVLPLLLALTETLPSDTWLGEVTFGPDEMVLTGYTENDVSEIVQLLSKMEGVKRAVLSGPAYFDRRMKRSRFEVTVALVDDGRVPK